jgi:serine/threonine protein kinase
MTNLDGDIKSSFNFLFVIGIGGFGKVWKVELRKKGILYAMKEMSKALYGLFVLS